MKNLILLLISATSFCQTITYDIYQDGVYKTSTTNTNYTITNLLPETTYNFYIITKDLAGNQSVPSNFVTITTLSKPVTYCSSYGKSSLKECINRVQLGSFSNPSGNNGGYGNFLTAEISLIRGGLNTITIYPYWSASILSEAYRVWIDYNRDGDFLDVGEQVLSRNKSKVASISGSFTVPATATVGITRMRISMKYNALPNSCEILNYGEVEDYSINIK